MILSFCVDRFLRRKGFEGVHLSKNFRQGDHILALLWSMYTLEGASLQKDTVEEVIQIFQNHVVQGLRTQNVLAAFKSFDDIQHVIKRNGTAMATIEPRSDEWLEKNGTLYCLFVHFMLSWLKLLISLFLS